MAWTLAIEAVGFWALILFYMWRIEPGATPATRVVAMVLLGLVPLMSLLLHHERLGEVGFGRAGLARSAREVGVATLAAALVIGAIGIVTGWRPRFMPAQPIMLAGYLVWGLLQQFALQAFVHRRLRQALGRPGPAALAAALCFGTLHLPNPVLAPFATLGGWIWCRLYARTPSLWTLAVSHAVCAVLIFWALPQAWTHNLKVGPGYYTWHP